MDKDLFNRIVDFLVPYMGDPSDRETLVRAALFGCRVLEQIDWRSAAHPFTVRLVHKLLSYGECAPDRPALALLLEEIKAHTGSNRHAEIDRLIGQIQQPDRGDNNMVTPEAAGFMFLLEVARWAKDELSQRWLYRRQQQAQSEVIAEQPAESPELQQVWAELTEKRSESEVRRILNLIRDQGTLILGYEESKTNARQQAIIDGNEMLLKNRLRHFDEEIENARREMRKHAEKLGIEIED